MHPVRALIIEDDPEWQDILGDEILRLAPKIEVVIAPNLERAESLLNDSQFDLITADLDLWGIRDSSPEALKSTIELLKRIRQTGPSRFAAIVIVSGHPEPENFSEILTLRLAQEFIPKGRGLNRGKFHLSIRQALLDARTLRVAAEADESVVLTLRTGDQEWFGCSLSGGLSADQSFVHPVAFPGAELAEKGDRIGQIFAAEMDLLAINSAWELGRIWRPAAKEVGVSIHREINAHPAIAEYLSSASVQGPDHHLFLRFSSPVPSAWIPFELIHDGDGFLCLKHPMARRVTGLGVDLQRPTETLSTLLHQLKQDGKTFRLLIVAAQSAGAPLPSLNAEIEVVEGVTRSELQDHLGVRVHPIVLKGIDANPQGVREAILKGAHFLHYAGHGLFDEKLAEKSGVVLHQGGLPKVLSAADLKGLVSDSSLRFCFFNCCLSARTATAPDRGDFVGLFEALLVGGVPTVLGHRWEVLDSSSVEFARAFYTNLWRSFRFEDAVLAARKAVAQGDLGRDDPCWASPILIDQSG